MFISLFVCMRFFQHKRKCERLGINLYTSANNIRYIKKYTSLTVRVKYRWENKKVINKKKRAFKQLATIGKKDLFSIFFFLFLFLSFSFSSFRFLSLFLFFSFSLSLFFFLSLFSFLFSLFSFLFSLLSYLSFFFLTIAI